MIAEIIIAQAVRNVYRKGHIYGNDGSLYMGRYTLFETDGLSARVHQIARPDHDRHLHDHPWNFASYVLRGGYTEQRPIDVNPCFQGDSEDCNSTYRAKGSWAWRHATDRHRISDVQPDTWTLFVYGRLAQWWGFYTPAGKIYWKDYLAQYGGI